jgi:tetratricopeptide (TPR) repeat protein
MAERTGSRRRPIWDSGAPSRVAEFLRSAAKKITLAQGLVFLLVLVVGLYLYRELTRNVLIIEPFNVPKQYADLGFTGEVIANHISDALHEIEKDTVGKQKQVGLTADEFMLSGDLPAAIDVEVPGTKLSLKTLVEITREAFGIYPKRVRGDVVLTTGQADTPVTVTVRFSASRQSDVTRRLTSPVNDPQQVSQLAAEAILRDVNPFLLGAYKYWQCDLNAVTDIAQEMSKSADALESARGHDLLGVVHTERRRWKAAVKEFQRATELEPRLTFAYANWGLALESSKKPDEAIAKYQKAAELDPSFSRVYAFWGFTLYQQGKTAEAVAKFQEAIRSNPQDPAPYLNWGVALVTMGKQEEALAKYEKATDMDPKFPGAYKVWGDALAGQQKWEQAAEKYGKATEANPRCADTYNSWGWMLHTQGQNDDAIAKFRKAIEIDPGSADAYNLWGNIFFEQNKMDKAIAKYQIAVQVDPMSVDGYNNWGHALEELGRQAEAQEKFAKAQALSSVP